MQYMNLGEGIKDNFLRISIILIYRPKEIRYKFVIILTSFWGYMSLTKTNKKGCDHNLAIVHRIGYYYQALPQSYILIIFFV